MSTILNPEYQETTVYNDESFSETQMQTDSSTVSKEDEDMFSLYLYMKNQRCVMVIPKSLLDEDMMSFLRKTLR